MLNFNTASLLFPSACLALVRPLELIERALDRKKKGQAPEASSLEGLGPLRYR